MLSLYMYHKNMYCPHLAHITQSTSHLCSVQALTCSAKQRYICNIGKIMWVKCMWQKWVVTYVKFLGCYIRNATMSLLYMLQSRVQNFRLLTLVIFWYIYNSCRESMKHNVSKVYVTKIKCYICNIIWMLHT